MKGFKDTTRVQYFRGGQVTREKACGGMVKKATGGKVAKGDETFRNDSERANDMSWKTQYQKGGNKTTRQERDYYLEPDFEKRPVKASPQDIHDYLVNRDRKPTKKAEGGRVTDPVKNKTGGKNDPEYGDYAISGAGAPANETKAVRKAQAAKTMRDTTGAAMLPAERRAMMKKAEGGKVDMKQDKKAVAAGVHKHERNMHPGKPLTKMQRGGFPSHNRAPMIKAR